MSPAAGEILVQQIVPHIRAAIPGCAKTIGAEDHEELVADCVCAAAQMLHRLEQSGKQVTPGNVAYYAILNTRSGRRSQGCGRTDVLGSGTQMAGRSTVLSMEEQVGLNPETGEAVTLGELLAGAHEDPASSAARRLDWQQFFVGHDARYPAMVGCAVSGQPMNSLGGKPGASNSSLSSLKRRLAGDIKASMGEDILQEVCRQPRWQADIEVEYERMRCRHERRHLVH